MRNKSIAASGAAVVIAVTTAIVGPGLCSGNQPEHRVTSTATSDGLPSRLFPQSRYWSKPIRSGTKTDPASSRWVNYVRQRLAAGPKEGPFLAVRSYGVPVWVGRPTDPMEQLGDCYSYSCPGIKNTSVRVPAGAKADPGSDGHMVIYDPNKQTAYDLYRARRSGGRWVGASAASVNVRSGKGGTGKRNGANAAHTALLAGLIRPQEIKRGRINHAIGVTIPGIGPGAPRCPADYNVPTTNTRNAPPEGTHFQLSKRANISGLPRTQKIVAKALQRYGMIVVDNGGTIAFRGENPIGKASDAWAAVGFPSGNSISLSGLPFDHLRVVRQPTC